MIAYSYHDADFPEIAMNEEVVNAVCVTDLSET